jgi:pyridoxal phosphate enzyme (YggS family)
MDSTNYLRQIKTNIGLVKERIEQAATKSGRKLSEIRFVAVSKAQPVEKIKAAIESGLTIFGENYPEESEPKILALQDENPWIEWHMIGHLQSRKADLVCKYFSMLHSLDSVHLAEKLNRRLASFNKKLPVLLEVNIGDEESKSGWLANEPQEWEILLVDFQRILAFDHLSVEGLMVMPPLGDDKEKSRPYFVKLRLLQEFLRKKIPASHWNELSMGTSFDYEIAIEEGATLVRIGEGFFGRRIYTLDRK